MSSPRKSANSAPKKRTNIIRQIVSDSIARASGSSTLAASPVRDWWSSNGNVTIAMKSAEFATSVKKSAADPSTSLEKGGEPAGVEPSAVATASSLFGSSGSEAEHPSLHQEHAAQTGSVKRAKKDADVRSLSIPTSCVFSLTSPSTLVHRNLRPK